MRASAGAGVQHNPLLKVKYLTFQLIFSPRAATIASTLRVRGLNAGTPETAAVTVSRKKEEMLQ